MVITVWLRIVTFVIEPTKDAIGNIVHALLSFKYNTSINRPYVIWSTMNTQAINILRRQVIGRYGLFTCKYWQKYILAHDHCHCNIIWGGAWFFCLSLDCLVFASFLQISSLDYFKNSLPRHPRWIQFNGPNKSLLWPLHVLTQNGALPKLFTCEYYQ